MKKNFLFVFTFIAVLCFSSLTFAAEKDSSESKDRWLIYWYISGHNLERNGGHMTADMQEMINVQFLSNLEDNGASMVEDIEENPGNSAALEDDEDFITKEEKPVVQPHVVFPLGTQLSPNVKVLIQTGGCSQWFNDDIPSNTISRYVCDTIGVHYQGAFEDVNMGDTTTLESFLRYGKEKIEKDFKPNRRIFIFSGHGGMAQVCYDERYEDSALDLNAVHRSFSKVFKSSPKNPPFEFVGFDACVRATYENANNLYGFARYMIASEETESAVGWYYTDWIRALSENPSMSTKRLGKMICQSSYDFLLEKDASSAEIATFSVIDLSPEKWIDLRKAYDSFGKVTFDLTQKDIYFYKPLAMAVNASKRYNIGDTYKKGLTADLKDFAENTQKYLPDDLDSKDKQKIIKAADDLSKAVDTAVAYNVYGNYAQGSNGIATYYPLENDFLEEDFELYAVQKSIPKNMKDVYERLVYGNITEDLSEDQSDNNPPATRSIRRKKSNKNSTRSLRSVFNIQSLQDLEINIDNDTDEVFVNLTKEQLKGVSSVSCTMGVSIEDGKPMMGINRDGLLILGESAAIKSDWNNGKFTDKFGAKWPMLNHHPVMTLISELTNDNLDENGKVLKSGYATYNIPVALNDEVCVLRVVYQNDSQAYQILGAVKNVPSKSKTRTLRAASRGITPLQKGDRISPILSAIIPTDNVSEQQNIILQKSIDDVLTLVIFTGETFTVDETLALQNETLENGDYYYQFNFNDPLGNQASSEYAYFDVFEGEVLYSDKVKTQDAEETQTESFDENSNNEVTDTTQ